MNVFTIIRDKAWELFPDVFMCHYAVAQRLYELYPEATSILDVGGIGRFKYFTNIPVTDANIKKGIDGQNLPYKDQQFDVVISINTLEHVVNRVAFISEAKRVSKLGCILCFPFDGIVTQTEKIKKSIGNIHPMPGGAPKLEELKKEFAFQRILYAMPSWLHLTFILALKRATPKCWRVINKQLIASKVWFCPKEFACTVIVDL